MKKLLFLCTLGACSLNHLNASQEGAYAQVMGGANWANVNKQHKFEPAKIDFNTGYLVGGSLGYGFCSGLRIEGEYSYRYNKIQAKVSNRQNSHLTVVRTPDGLDLTVGAHGKVHTSAVLANVLWELPTTGLCFRPYVGAGVGYAWNKSSVNSLNFHNDKADVCIKIPSIGAKSDGLAWQLIAGASMPLTCCMDLGVEYRYFKSTKHVNNHGLVVASKYNF